LKDPVAFGCYSAKRAKADKSILVGISGHGIPPQRQAIVAVTRHHRVQHIARKASHTPQQGLTVARFTAARPT
jgi:hypothetical protein